MPTLKILMKQRVQNQEVRNVFHVAGGDATQANAQDFIDYFRSLWATNFTSLLHTSWNLYGASAKELDIVSNPTIDYTLTAGTLTGTNNSNLLPTQVAKLVTWISFTARPNRGRTYLAGFCEDVNDSDGQLVAGGILTACANWANGMIAVDSVHSGAALTITRVASNGTLVGSNIIESFRNIGNPAIQRRRRIGVGQ